MRHIFTSFGELSFIGQEKKADEKKQTNSSSAVNMEEGPIQVTSGGPIKGTIPVVTTINGVKMCIMCTMQDYQRLTTLWCKQGKLFPLKYCLSAAASWLAG